MGLHYNITKAHNLFSFNNKKSESLYRPPLFILCSQID